MVSATRPATQSSLAPAVSFKRSGCGLRSRRQSASSPESAVRCKALVFDSESAALIGIKTNGVAADDIVILRHCGPAGAPAARPPTALAQLLAQSTSPRVITDGPIPFGASGEW